MYIQLFTAVLNTTELRLSNSDQKMEAREILKSQVTWYYFYEFPSVFGVENSETSSGFTNR